MSRARPTGAGWIVVTLALALAPAAPRADAPAPAPPADSTDGDRVPAHDTFFIPSRTLHETRRINVYTPPGYLDDTKTRYLLIVMPDGGLGEDFPHVASDVDSAIRHHEMRPAIVVGIENTERRRDMTGPTTVEADRRIAPHVGGSAAFRAFLRDELLPEVRRRYRVSGESALIGESLAGLFTLETLWTDPRLFGTYIVMSPSLWWDGGALVKGAATRLAATPKLEGRLYLTHGGDDDIDDACRTLAKTLEDGAPPALRWTYTPHPELGHATIYRGASPGILRALFPPQGAGGH